MLKHVKRVFVQFTPGDPKSVAARELLQRLSGSSAKKSNPQCKVDFSIDEDGKPGSAFVELTFADDEKRKIGMADNSVVDVSRMIEQKGNEMELKTVLKEVCLHVHANAPCLHMLCVHCCAASFHQCCCPCPY